MSTDYYIADLKNQRLFEIGRSGAISENVPMYSDFIRLDAMMSGKPSRYEPKAYVGFVRACMKSRIQNCTEDQARDVFDFCQEADWNVRVVNDSDCSVPRWMITHSVFSYEHAQPEDRLPQRYGGPA